VRILSRREWIGGACAGLVSAQAPRSPNVLLIVVDDWGATDLGCAGSSFYDTPNIDRFAASGMRFTQAYSACTVCSPSRAAIMTGKYPARLHITDWIAGHQYPWAKLRPPDWTQHLPLEETTLAERFRSAGYATSSIGKWHLGGPDFYPDKQGFDRNLGGTHAGQPPSYFSPYKIATLPDGPPGEYLTDRECSEALSFIEAERRQPWFVYLPHYAVHTPLQGKQAVIEKYRQRAGSAKGQGDPVYAAMVEGIDESIGRLLAGLERLGLAERTIVALTSDNGGLLRSTTNLGLRAGKGSAYEGGVRVPLIVRWPGVTRPGSTSEVPVMGMDLHPTLVAMAGLAAPGGIDGVDFSPLLRRSRTAPRPPLFWHYPHYHPGGATPYSAIRDGRLKLIEFYEDNHVELYDLEADPEEKTDLAASRTRDAERLRSRLARWRTEMGAQMPLPNPDYDPARAAQLGRGRT
jgi:arylsulfatase A-like enzyme